MLDAAGLAGLNVLSLVNSHAAAALQFGIERSFANKSEHVLFYDMGSSSTQVTRSMLATSICTTWRAARNHYNACSSCSSSLLQRQLAESRRPCTQVGFVMRRVCAAGCPGEVLQLRHQGGQQDEHIQSVRDSRHRSRSVSTQRHLCIARPSQHCARHRVRSSHTVAGVACIPYLSDEKGARLLLTL
jgi:Hsp70 protein